MGAGEVRDSASRRGSDDEGRMGLVGPSQCAGEVGAKAAVEHRVLAGCLDVAQRPKQRARTVCGRASGQAMRGGAHLHRDVGAVLNRKEGSRLQHSVDGFVGYRTSPALVSDVEQPGARPAEQDIGGCEVPHADMIVEERAPPGRPATNRLPVHLVESPPGRCRASLRRVGGPGTRMAGGATEVRQPMADP